MPHINHRRGETRRSVHREVRCSCTMCGNPRRNGWGRSRTFQELLAPLPTEGEPATRRYKKQQGGRKRFTLEKRQSDQRGGWEDWWVCYKHYRTKRYRDNALEAFRKSALELIPGNTRIRLCYEFREGPMR